MSKKAKVNVAVEEKIEPVTLSAAASKKAEPMKKVESEKPSFKFYFRNAKYSALQVRTGEAGFHVLGPRFVPFYEMFQGDRVLVGYFATNDSHEADLMRHASGTEEISQKQYNDAVYGKHAWKAPQPR